jgi:spore germination protein KB
MSKEIISDKMGISIMTMFILGSSFVVGTGWAAERDVWLAIFLAAAMSLPIMIICSRILTLYPGKDLFDILEIIFGKMIGKFIQILFFWYPFFIGALVIRDIFEFIGIAGLPGTPGFIPNLFMIIVCILVIKDGIEVLGRILTFVLPIILIIILLETLLSVPFFELSNIRPVMYNGFKPIFFGAFQTFSFPFAQTVIFTMVLSSLKSQVSSFKIYYMSLLFGGLILILITVRNVLILGDEFVHSLYFPSYSALSVVKFGTFVERIEIAVTVVFLFTCFAKISVCMYAATKGFAKIFHLGDYRTMVAPVGLVMSILSQILFENASDFAHWNSNINPYYSLLFTVILPVFILIAAEIKVRIKIRE